MSPINIAALTVALVAVEAMAPASPASNGGVPGIAKSSADRMVCKSELRTGTRFKERTCMTMQEWEAMHAEHKRAGRDMIDRPVNFAPVCAGSDVQKGVAQGC